MLGHFQFVNLLQYWRQIKKIFQSVTITWHVDASNVCTHINKDNLANHIATLPLIVLKKKNHHLFYYTHNTLSFYWTLLILGISTIFTHCSVNHMYSIHLQNQRIWGLNYCRGEILHNTLFLMDEQAHISNLSLFFCNHENQIVMMILMRINVIIMMMRK